MRLFLLDFRPVHKEVGYMLATIHTDKAPQAIGPYSRKVQRICFRVGSDSINPAPAGVAGTAGEKTKLVLENIGRILGSRYFFSTKLLGSTIYLTDLNEFDEVK